MYVSLVATCRGYYRCSSSKACPARKQVERSRTDPNMLVITYTSEHNHPWPTHRNALAGSSRSQPSKNNNIAASKNEEEDDEDSNSDINKVNNNAFIREEDNSVVLESFNTAQYLTSRTTYNLIRACLHNLEKLVEE